MSMTGRTVMLDNIAAGVADDEIDYLITKIGVARVKECLNRVMNTNDELVNAREKMPPTLEINGVVYWRRSQ